MAYEVPPLPYDYAALEPHIDEQTMRLHHDKHHQAYVDKANGALEGTEWEDKPVEEVIANLGSLPEDKQGVVRNNGGGHANHSLFWESMSPDGGASRPVNSPRRSTTPWARSRPSRSSSRRPRASSVRLGLARARRRAAGEQHPQPGQPARAAPRRCWAWTCGNTRTTSIPEQAP